LARLEKRKDQYHCVTTRFIELPGSSPHRGELEGEKTTGNAKSYERVKKKLYERKKPTGIQEIYKS